MPRLNSTRQAILNPIIIFSCILCLFSFQASQHIQEPTTNQQIERVKAKRQAIDILCMKTINTLYNQLDALKQQLLKENFIFKQLPSTMPENYVSQESKNIEKQNPFLIKLYEQIFDEVSNFRKIAELRDSIPATISNYLKSTQAIANEMLQIIDQLYANPTNTTARHLYVITQALKNIYEVYGTFKASIKQIYKE